MTAIFVGDRVKMFSVELGRLIHGRVANRRGEMATVQFQNWSTTIPVKTLTVDVSDLQHDEKLPANLMNTND